MKKLSAAVDRFAMKHPGFGIPNLMKYIVIGNVLVYLLSAFSGYEAVSFWGSAGRRWPVASCGGW